MNLQCKGGWLIIVDYPERIKKNTVDASVLNNLDELINDLKKRFNIQVIIKKL
jgi:hypothetical protein